MINEIERKELLKKICEKLLGFDPDIVEIIQFGSSIYAPEYARDIDLLVISRNPKKYDAYLNAINEVGSLFDVDIIVVKPEQELKEDLIRGILGAFKILYGSGRYIFEYAKVLGDPSFEEARVSLRAARDYLSLALRAEDSLKIGTLERLLAHYFMLRE